MTKIRVWRDSLRRNSIRKEPDVKPIVYENASAEVRAVYDDIKKTRKVDDVNNFWKHLAHDPRMLRHVWESLKDMMGPGALDPLTKELIYIAVSITNGCEYCMASHTTGARQKGASEEMIREVYAVTG